MKGVPRKRYPELRHATTWQNYNSILETGLQVAASDKSAARRAIWLHGKGQTPWAIIHTMWRHGCTLEEVVIMVVAVEREKVKHHGKGLWYTLEDIPAKRIRWIFTAEQFAQGTALTRPLRLTLDVDEERVENLLP